MNIRKFNKSDDDVLVDSIRQELELGNSNNALKMANNLIRHIDYLEKKRDSINMMIEFAREDIRTAQDEAMSNASIQEQLNQIKKARDEKKAEEKAAKKALKKAKIKAEAEAQAAAEIEAKAKAEAKLKLGAEAVKKAEEDAKAKNLQAEAEKKAKIEAEAERMRLAELNAKAIADASAKAEAEKKAQIEADEKAEIEAEIAKKKAEVASLKAEAEELRKAKADNEEGSKAMPKLPDNQEAVAEKKQNVIKNKKNGVPPQQIPDLPKNQEDSDEGESEDKPVSKKPVKHSILDSLKDLDKKLKEK